MREEKKNNLGGKGQKHHNTKYHKNPVMFQVSRRRSTLKMSKGKPYKISYI